MANIADLGARLTSFSIQHPDAASIAELYQALNIDRPPAIVQGRDVGYRAQITAQGRLRELF